MSKLPKNWREITQDGVTLYWTRCCSNYLVLPTGDGKFQWEWQWHVMGVVDTLQDALIACREHMHERNQVEMALAEAQS